MLMDEHSHGNLSPAENSGISGLLRSLPIPFDFLNNRANLAYTVFQNGRMKISFTRNFRVAVRVASRGEYWWQDNHAFILTLLLVVCIHTYVYVGIFER